MWALEGVVPLLRDTLELLDLSGPGSQVAEQYCKTLLCSRYDGLKVLLADRQDKNLSQFHAQFERIARQHIRTTVAFASDTLHVVL